MSRELAGQEVSMTVSDPWEFGSEVGVGPHRAEIVFVGDSPETAGVERLLLRLRQPLKYRGTTCEYIVAQPRYVGEQVTSLGGRNTLACNFTVVSPERAAAPNPVDLSWWRGGVAMVGALSGLSAKSNR